MVTSDADRSTLVASGRTVTLQSACRPFCVYTRMTALPVLTPRTLPSESTVAMDGALLSNVNVAAQSEPPSKVAVGVSLTVPPMLRLLDVMSRVTASGALVTRTVQ